MQKERKLNILFMASWFPSRHRPTDGNFILRHAEAVGSLHTVEVVHVITDDTKKDTTTEWTYRKENNVGIHIGYIPKLQSPINKYRAYFKAYKEGWSKLKNKPDVLHLNVIFPAGLFALYFSKKYNIPFIITEHWTGYHAENTAKTKPFIWRLHRHIAKRAKFLCPVSHDLKHSMLQLNIKGQYCIVPNVVDTQTFSQKPDSTNTPFKLLHVSTLIDEHKNITGLLTAFKEVLKSNASFQLTIVGDGDLKPHKKTASKLGLDKSNVEFFGAQSPESIASFMQESNVFVLFSNYENLPCVILESFSTGTPVISTKVGGIAEHFPEYSGILIEQGNQQELKKAILSIKANYEQYNPARISNYAQAHFSVDKIAHSFEKLYFESLKKN